MLEKSVIGVFEKEISTTQALLAKYAARPTPPGFNPESIPSRKRFLNKRRKLLTSLLRWRKFTGDRFGVRQLVNQLVEGCMMGIALGGWEVGGMEIAMQVRIILLLLSCPLVSLTIPAARIDITSRSHASRTTKTA